MFSSLEVERSVCSLSNYGVRIYTPSGKEAVKLQHKV